MIKLNRIGNKLGLAGAVGILLAIGMVANQMITEARIEEASERATKSQHVANNALAAHIDLRKIQLAAGDVRLSRKPAEVAKAVADLQRHKESAAKELEAALATAQQPDARERLQKTKGLMEGFVAAVEDLAKGNVDKAKKMLEESLNWRSTYKPEEIRWHEVAHEGETGKVSRANFHDRQGRTVLIMRPGMQNTNSPENNIRHLVYLIENGIINLPEGQEQMSWLIDFTGFSFSTNIQVKTARDIINILQSHYPERLAICLLYNPPRIFQTFFKAVRYFIDPKTSQKVKFAYPKNKESVELMKSFFDIDNLPSEFGGKATLKYDHEEFSRMMAEDDIKTAKFWGVDEKPNHITNGHLRTEVAKEPIPA